MKSGAGDSPCNPSYSEVKDQVDHSSKPVQANCFGNPILKIPNTKMVNFMKLFVQLIRCEKNKEPSLNDLKISLDMI
jgi:hypothetical protein